VINAPELNNNKVFISGIEKASIVIIPAGGHTPPIEILELKLEWKKAQNTLKNTNISLIMNNIIAITIPRCTSLV